MYLCEDIKQLICGFANIELVKFKNHKRFATDNIRDIIYKCDSCDMKKSFKDHSLWKKEYFKQELFFFTTDENNWRVRGSKERLGCYHLCCKCKRYKLNIDFEYNNHTLKRIERKRKIEK